MLIFLNPSLEETSLHNKANRRKLKNLKDVSQ